jgi:hypothetical protein
MSSKSLPTPTFLRQALPRGLAACRMKTLTPTDMPQIRVVLDSMTVLRPPGAALPW